jgi:hypothetical protein
LKARADQRSHECDPGNDGGANAEFLGEIRERKGAEGIEPGKTRTLRGLDGIYQGFRAPEFGHDAIEALRHEDFS